MHVEDDVESILYIAREVSVYKIPPLKANEGYRANDWGDLAQPLWKGRLRILESSKDVTLRLEDGQTGELFARTPYDPVRPSVEAVLDSSRYFVVRIEDAGKKAYIGLGFAERTDSFDFNVALQDYAKRQKAMLDVASGSEAASPHISAGPRKDYSLKEGQTFSIAIPGRNKGSNNTNLIGTGQESSNGVKISNVGSVPLLPPPPSANRKR